MRFVLVSKWIAAAALAFALTLPFTTCAQRMEASPRSVAVPDRRSGCLISYAALSVADLVVIFRGRRRDRAHTHAVLAAE